MDSDDEKYEQDKRTPCKYGKKCYQKNSAHHEKYKHPSKKLKNSTEPPNKKFKPENKVIDESDSEYSIDDDSNSNSEKYRKENTKVNNDVSSSDSESSQDAASDFEEDNDKSAEELTESIKPSSTHNSVLTEKTVENGKSDVNDDDPKNKTKTLSEKEQEWSSFIKDKFLFTMPEDFYQFWNFCEKLKPSSPLQALKEVGLYLVGPFDVLAGKFSNVTKSESEYLLHWRYYRDPPEFQTVLKSDDPPGYHIGYFRDAPDQLPVLLASNSPKKDGILTPMGGNIFSAVNLFLEDLKKTGNPFKKMAISRIQMALKKESDALKIDLSKKTKAMVTREKKIVSRTFNKIGLCVPYDRKTLMGYRELAQSNKELEANFTKLQSAKTKEEKETYLTVLQPVFTYASIATDECDFGTGIELGWNIISHGIDSLNATAERFLASNYRLLNMDAFAKIAEAHMRNRKQSFDLSIL